MVKQKQALNLALVRFISFSLLLYTFGALTAMAPMNIAFAIVGVAFILIQFLKLNPSPYPATTHLYRRKLLQYTLALSAACCISLIFATFDPFRYVGHAPTMDFHTYYKLWHLGTPFVFLSVFAVAQRQSGFSLNNVTRVWWWTLSLLTPIAIQQFFTGWPHKQFIPTSNQYNHATLFLGHHLSVASIMIFPAFTALSVSYGQWRRQEPISRLALTSGLGGLIILFLCFARTAWLTLPIALILILLGASRAKIKRSHILIAAVVMIGFSIAAWQHPIIQSRMGETHGGIDQRLHLWRANLDYFYNRPFTGIGFLKTSEMSEYYFISVDPAGYRNYIWSHAHSNFFEMLGGTGGLGFIAFIAWIIFTLKMARQLTTTTLARGHYFLSDLSHGLFVALIVLHLNGLTNVNFWEGKVLHQHLFAIGLLLMISYESERLSVKL